MAVSGIIPVSGLDNIHQAELVTSPEGLFGSGSGVFLSSVNASFGFGSSPHSFSLTYVPSSFEHELLPSIGTLVDFTIDNFLVKGAVVHADYSKDSQGNLLSVTVEDLRSGLGYFYIDTVGINGRNDTPETNTVDVLNWYNTTTVAPATSGRSSAVRELQRIEEDGATYRQIYNATEYFESTVGTVSGLLSALPIPEVVENQLSGDQDAYRWKLASVPALDAVEKIFSDLSYDIYWNMADAKIPVINRKYSVSISKDNIPFPGDTAETVHLKYGNDEADTPNKLKVLGPGMEGIVGSGRLIPTSGAFSESYDMGITVGDPVFEAGWNNVTVKYFGPDGSLQEDTPTDDELSAALKSIEYWSHEKNLENRISTSGYVPGSGAFVGQVPATEYLSQMTSRYNSSKSWIVAWYNKIKSFAETHYGKTYILKTDSSLYSYIDDIDLVGEAWCNIENQASGNFEDGYKIDSTYNLLSPFYNSKSNKMKAYCVLPSGTKWGVTGEGVPTRFESWNEDASNQFVPIKTKMWKSSKNRFESPIFEWGNSEKGISITFPNFCYDPNAPRNSGLLAVSSGISTANNAFETGDWTADFADPLLNPVPYLELNPASGQSVALPIRVKRRYGYAYPSVWTSGTGSKLQIRIEDSFAPWNYEPQGVTSSVQKLEREVSAYLASQKIDTQDATHAEVTKVGLPGMSFDDFSVQTLGSQGYGSISHGITSVNVGRGGGENWRTKYSVKSHFPQLVKAKPIQKDREEDLSFVIKQIKLRMEDIDIDLNLKTGGAFAPIDDTRLGWMQVESKAEKRSVPVTIENVYDRASGNPYYLCSDARGREYPRNLSLNAGTQSSREARAIDGLLDIGMECTYHYERLEDGTIVQWFTGGVNLGDSKVMTVTSDVKTVAVGGTDYSVVDLATIPTGGGVALAVTNVPLIDQTNTATVTNGIVVSVASPMIDTNIRTYDFTPASGGAAGLYVQNPGGGTSPSGAEFATVTTAPEAASGTGGVLTTFDVGNLTSTVYNDAASGVKVSFVGIDPKIVQLGDVGILSVRPDTEQIVPGVPASGTTAITHVLCHIVKPTFINYGLV